MSASIIDTVLPTLTVIQKTLRRSLGWLNIDEKKSFGRRAIDIFPQAPVTTNPISLSMIEGFGNPSIDDAAIAPKDRR
tara:strand:+ start:761 stop:994 length:234 start_codon:yes stop_codon:yes gene_type:complete